MKTSLTIAIVLVLGVASLAFAFDQDSMNSKKALVTYGGTEMNEKEAPARSHAENAEPSKKKATVAVTHEKSISSDDQDLGGAEAVSAHSSKGSGTTFK